MFRPSSAALAAALLVATACDEAAAPAGERGSITVTAYVDLDASGSVTAGDELLQDFDLELWRDGSLVATAETEANGRATFADIPPGGYRIVPVGPEPPGAALATSPSPTAVVSFQGTAPTVEFRYVWYPGTITGRLFRNDGGTNEYEPGTDTPGAGVTVYLRSDAGGTPGDTIRSTTTDAEGVYGFTNLAPGTYFLEFEQLGAMNYGASGRIFAIEVAARSTSEQTVRFTGSIFMTIAEARAAADDETVAVVGTITVPADVFTSSGGVNSEIWVQDATGGIAVFSVPSAEAAQYPLGRVLEVVGTRDTFNGKEQIVGPTTRSRGAGTPVSPQTVTGTQANSLADEGELVLLANARVDTVPTGTSSSFSVWVTAADGQTVVVRVATGTEITRNAFVKGNHYDVTGILTEFNGTAQIQPRFDSDIVELGAPVARLIINEFMANPNAVFDSQGEYIELHNWGDASQDLQGWTIRDNFGVDTIDVPLVIPAGGYLLFAVHGDPAVNGGLTVDFVYKPEIALGNSGDRIILKDPTGVTVDSIAYTSGASAGAGIAVGVVDPSQDNTEATLGVAGINWAAQTSTFGSGGDRGTPRAQNDGYVAPSPTRVPLPSGPAALGRDPVAPARATSRDGGARR